MAAIFAGTQIPIGQAVTYARNAGFLSNGLTYVVAIALAESRLYSHAVNTSDPAGGSFGVLQINGAHFGEAFGGGRYTMSQSAAFDPALSFLFAYQLSNGGRNFNAWSTYTGGQYTAYISQVQPYTGFGGSTPVTAASTGAPQGASFPSYGGTPWYDYPMYSDSDFTGANGYHNTDIGTPTDTPITAPLPGTITYLGYFDWGGQVSWKVDNTSVTRGVPEIFVIHMDAINPNLKVGQHIQAGTFLGYSGGELSANGLPPLPNGLTHHVTLPSHTTGPHLDIGVTDSTWASLDVNQAASNAVVDFAKQQQLPYGTGIGGGSADGIVVGGSSGSVLDAYATPANFQQSLLPLGFSVAGRGISYDKLATDVHATLVQNPSFYGMALALDKAEQFPGVYNAYSLIDIINPLSAASDTFQSVMGTVIGNTLPFLIRMIIILTGFLLLLMLLWQLSKPAVEILPQLLSLAGA